MKASAMRAQLDPGLKTKAVTDIWGTTEKTEIEGWYLI